MARQLELTCVCMNEENQDFVLVFTCDGEILFEKEEVCFDDCLIDLHEFFHSCCEKVNFDSRFDVLTIDVRYKYDFAS